MGKAKNKVKGKVKAEKEEIPHGYHTHNEEYPACIFEVTLINLIRHLTMKKVISMVPDDYDNNE